MSEENWGKKPPYLSKVFITGVLAVHTLGYSKHQFTSNLYMQYNTEIQEAVTTGSKLYFKCNIFYSWIIILEQTEYYSNEDLSITNMLKQLAFGVIFKVKLYLNTIIKILWKLPLWHK